MTASSVSIAMATYNGEPHLGELLQSLARQTHPPRELVVTDDLYSDATPDGPQPVNHARGRKDRGSVGLTERLDALPTGEAASPLGRGAETARVEGQRIATVVPFFQEQPGLLRRAVTSVLQQDGIAAHTLNVVVVDDGSPIPATLELSDLEVPNWASLEILRKPNGGVGSARNTGLDYAASIGCKYVAFLDSDDWWTPNHLKVALNCLANGSTFYFANSMHDDVPSFSYFESESVLLRSQTPRSLIGMIDGDLMFEMLLKECFTHTSQVVYDLSAFPHIRFNEGLRRSGEDHLFWLSIAQESRSSSYTTEIMGFRGRGVSVYRNALVRSSPEYLHRLLDGASFRTILPVVLRLNRDQARLNRQLRQDVIDLIGLSIVRNLYRRPYRGIADISNVIRRLGITALLEISMTLPRLGNIRLTANGKGH